MVRRHTDGLPETDPTVALEALVEEALREVEHSSERALVACEEIERDLEP
jgi:hypothetical protein